MELMDLMERMEAAVKAVEVAAEKMNGLHGEVISAAEERVGRIVATVENDREVELQKQLVEAEARIAELQVAANAGRKTVSAGAMASKGLQQAESGALDAALASLSVEQRLAVKSELLRTGAIG